MLQVKHSINLYLPRFRPPQLSAAMQRLIKVCGGALLGLVLITALLFFVKLYLQNQFEFVKQEQARLNEELSVVIAQLPNTVVDKNLQMRITREEKLLAKQRRVITFLRQDSISDSSSFTPLVEQLSQQNVKGIWLSKFEVINQGQDIQLFGFAKTPEQVSRYLSMLGTQPAYQGRAFKQINVVKGEQSWNEFFLSTQKEETDTADSFAASLSGAGL